MENRIPVVFAWSGGKDSAYALYLLMQDTRYDIRYLLSTINGNNGRLSMHGIREDLIEAQAAGTGIPLLKVYVYESNNLEYEQQMKSALLRLKKEGVEMVAFGDIFLEDLREYREHQIEQLGMGCLFPLWKKDTLQLVTDFITKGFKTFVCCVSDQYLNESWCGRLIDEAFVSQQPSSVDPCGENGEFHSFCFAGPVYKKAINILKGEKIYKPLEPNMADRSVPAKGSITRGFWYCDLLPGPKV